MLIAHDLLVQEVRDVLSHLGYTPDCGCAVCKPLEKLAKLAAPPGFPEDSRTRRDIREFASVASGTESVHQEVLDNSVEAFSRILVSRCPGKSRVNDPEIPLQEIPAGIDWRLLQWQKQMLLKMRDSRDLRTPAGVFEHVSSGVIHLIDALQDAESDSRTARGTPPDESDRQVFGLLLTPEDGIPRGTCPSCGLFPCVRDREVCGLCRDAGIGEVNEK